MQNPFTTPMPETHHVLDSGRMIWAGCHCYRSSDDLGMLTDEADIDEAWSHVNRNCREWDAGADERRAARLAWVRSH